MPGSHNDVRQVVTDNLRDDASLRALVSERVYGAHLQEADAVNIDYPLVVVSLEGGDGLGWEGAIQRQRFTLWAYSKVALGQAGQVYDLARGILHVERLTVANVTPAVVCQEVGAPQDGWNESVRAWYVTGQWVARTVG